MPILSKQKITEYQKQWLEKKAAEDGASIAQVVRYAIQKAAHSEDIIVFNGENNEVV